jgi:uncharacterized protein YdhG (YjbR/CyaY superfamily)
VVVSSVEAYITQAPEPSRAILKSLRVRIHEWVPNAEESIAYGMPAYKINGKPLIYFAGYKNHIGIYALPNAHNHFKKELSGYKQGKGSVQFPLSEPLPFDLIQKIVEFNITKISN